MTCESCGAVFVNVFQLGPHRRVCRKALACTEIDDGLQLPLQTPTAPAPLYELAQRQPGFGKERGHVTVRRAPYFGQRTRDYKGLQKMWINFVRTNYTRMCRQAFLENIQVSFVTNYCLQGQHLVGNEGHSLHGQSDPRKPMATKSTHSAFCESVFYVKMADFSGIL